MASRQGECYAGITVTFVIASAALGLRFYARRLMHVRLSLDDYLCIVAYTFAAICSGLMLHWTWYGLGKFLRDVPRPQEVIVRDSLLHLWILEFTYAYSLGFSKLSILALYWRFFSLFKIRVPIIILACGTIIWLLCRTFIGLFHCYPVQAFWDKSIPNAKCPIDDAEFEFGTVLVHVFLDVTIFSLPIFQIRKLKTFTTSERLAVLAMFLSGAFVCIVSIVNLTQLYAFLHATGSVEVLWNTAPPALWGQIEINMAILAVSLPLMRPVVTKAFRALPGSLRGTQDQESQGAWSRVVHLEWLGKISSISSGTMATRRSSAAPGAKPRPVPPLEKGAETLQWQIPFEVISRIWIDEETDGQRDHDIFSILDCSIWMARPEPPDGGNRQNLGV